MVNTLNRLGYKAFGFHVISEIPLPELQVANKISQKVDIIISKADLSSKWSEMVPLQENYIVKSNFFMFKVSNTAIFSIENGREITFSPFKGANEDKIRLFILGTCMGALLLQRRILPLHGSAIAMNGKAYAIVGDSGAGKSTLASVLMEKGFPLLSDDVIAIKLSKNHLPFVIPSYPQQKLWLESLEVLGLEIEHYSPLFERETKYAVPVPSQYSEEELPLAGVFELVKNPKQKIELREHKGLEKIYTLLRHTYRNLLISRMELLEWHFLFSTKIANQINLFELSRPTFQFSAYDLSERLIKTIESEGFKC